MYLKFNEHVASKGASSRLELGESYVLWKYAR